MNKRFVLATLWLSLSMMVHAEVVYYDGTGGYGDLDVSYTTTSDTGQVAIDAAHRYFPTATEFMYFGGSVTFNRSGGVWDGTRFRLLIGSAADFWTYSPPHGADSALLMAQDGQPNWLFGGSTEWTWAGTQDTGISANTPGSFDFVIKLEKKSPWEEVRMKIFLGTKATAATEGTPDFVWETNAFNLTLDYMSWSFNAGSGTPSMTTSNMFSSDVWHPVGPRPAGLPSGTVISIR
jgi:hypothetical protein